MDHSILVLGFVQLRIDHFRLEKSAKKNWSVSLYQSFVVAELRLSIVAPNKQPLLGSDGTGVHNATRNVRGFALELDLVTILEVSEVVGADA